MPVLPRVRPPIPAQGRDPGWQPVDMSVEDFEMLDEQDGGLPRPGHAVLVTGNLLASRGSRRRQLTSSGSPPPSVNRRSPDDPGSPGLRRPFERVWAARYHASAGLLMPQSHTLLLGLLPRCAGPPKAFRGT